jgi:nucleoside-diphosphate-sugar epimerase
MLLALGLGYSARALAKIWRARGARVAGTMRDVARADPALGRDGIALVPFSATSPLDPLAEQIAAATHVLVSIPPRDSTAREISDARAAESGSTPDLILQRLADRIAESRNIVWLGYLSTTGVYGDRAGAWVDETSDLRPGNPRSVQRAATEAAWLALWRDRGVPVHVFRLSGIYGPGRSAIDQLRAGTAKRIDKPGQIFSRIHVDDIAGALEASMARPRPGGIYNVADDMPAPAHEVVARAAALLGKTPPPLEPYDPQRLTPMAREFYAETRRVSNARLKRELGYALQYSDYNAGLASILDA